MQSWPLSYIEPYFCETVVPRHPAFINPIKIECVAQQLTGLFYRKPHNYINYIYVRGL